MTAALSASVAAQHGSRAALIWRDPGDTASLDVLNGAGGKAHAPRPGGPFTFIEEDPQGTSPKFDITDGQGVRWKVKLGDETQSETAATRLLWAAGYFVDEDYYLAQLTVKRLPALRRGGKFVSAGGAVHGARLERKVKAVKKLGTWDWFDNPFVDKRELNGLRVMMSLLNNWDLKAINNSIEDVAGERRYIVTDVGATFGNTGNSLTRSKADRDDYSASTFIERASPDFVDFVMHSRPFALSAINVPNYRERTRMEQITKHIPRADAKWLGGRLSRLSTEQLRDCFRAAGYAGADVERWTDVVRARIAELSAL
jgi:hypothetical protein